MIFPRTNWPHFVHKLTYTI